MSSERPNLLNQLIELGKRNKKQELGDQTAIIPIHKWSEKPKREFIDLAEQDAAAQQ